MSKQLIIIGGTPCTGKTEVATSLSKQIKTDVVHLGELSEKSGCVKEFDDSRDTGIIDEDCLVNAIIDRIDSGNTPLILEGHYIDLVPSSNAKIVVILRTHPGILKDRLAGRGYSLDKINENVEAEVFGVCQMDALDAFGEDIVFEVDTSELSVEESTSVIIKLLEGKGKPTRFDWMSLLEDEGRFEEFVHD